MKLEESMDWHTRVYESKPKNSYLSHAEWRLLRDDVFRRDRFTCIRCDTKFHYKKQLTAHHVIPREQGGSDDLSNLVTLCGACHDYVEINGLKSRAEIIGSYETPAPVGMIEEYQAVDWHEWVYGGARRPSGKDNRV